MLAVWGDEATIAHALAFEAALAKAQAAHGLIPDETAERIAAACETLSVDPSALAEEAALAGTLAIPLVRRLRAVAGDAVHRGATSQDVADTVLVIQAREATALLIDDCDRLVRALDAIARRHADTPAIGRTLLQDALPIGWGLRVAHWAAGIGDATDRLRHEMHHAGIVQLGGAVGTRAGMDGQGGGTWRRG